MLAGRGRQLKASRTAPPQSDTELAQDAASDNYPLEAVGLGREIDRLERELGRALQQRHRRQPRLYRGDGNGGNITVDSEDRRRPTFVSRRDRRDKTAAQQRLGITARRPSVGRSKQRPTFGSKGGRKNSNNDDSSTISEASSETVSHGLTGVVDGDNPSARVGGLNGGLRARLYRTIASLRQDPGARQRLAKIALFHQQNKAAQRKQRREWNAARARQRNKVVRAARSEFPQQQQKQTLLTVYSQKLRVPYFCT